MTVEIKHKKTGEPLLRVDADTLERADLRGVVLRGADLSHVSLREANVGQPRWR